MCGRGLDLGVLRASVGRGDVDGCSFVGSLSMTGLKIPGLKMLGLKMLGLNTGGLKMVGLDMAKGGGLAVLDEYQAGYLHGMKLHFSAFFTALRMWLICLLRCGGRMISSTLKTWRGLVRMTKRRGGS